MHDALRFFGKRLFALRKLSEHYKYIVHLRGEIKEWLIFAQKRALNSTVLSSMLVNNIVIWRLMWLGSVCPREYYSEKTSNGKNLQQKVKKTMANSVK